MKNEGNMDLVYGSSISIQIFGMEFVESRIINFFKEKQRWFCFGLLIIICVVLLFVCFVFVMYVILFLFRKEKDVIKDEVKYCILFICLEVVVVVKKSLNEFVDLCEDFYQYFCGSWIENNLILLLEIIMVIFIIVVKKNDERLLLFLLEDDEFLSEYVVKKVKNYFKFCMIEDDDNNIVIVVELKSFIWCFGFWLLDVVIWNVLIWSFNYVLLEIYCDYFVMIFLFVMIVDVNFFDLF